MIKHPSERIGKTYDFHIEGTLDFKGQCKIIGIHEKDNESGNHVYQAILLSVQNGNRELWTGGILESEIQS